MDLNLQLNLGDSLKFSPEIEFSNEVYDVMVLGGGPAGLNAALYAKRKGLNVGIITKQTGGQVINTSVVENYLGTKSLNGEELVQKFSQHVKSLNVPILEYAEVNKINTSDTIHEIILSDNSVYKAKTIIIATGSQPRKLNVPGEKTFAGRGVAYCAICDAPLFKGKNVIIAGGGNSAVEAALDLAKVANHVTIVHRSSFRADKVLIEQLNKAQNIKVHLETQIKEIVGDDAMTGILVLDKKNGEESVINADGIFIEIGHVASSNIFKDMLELNEHGEIIVDEKNRTNIPGIFAAGDITQVPYKQIVIAVSDGAKAALAANEYLNQKL